MNSYQQAIDKINEAVRKQAKSLDLSHMGLLNLPKDIKKLKNLKKLNIQGNKFSTLPKELGQLKQLEWLDASNNRIGGLPSELAQLRQVKKIKLSHNKLSNLPRFLRYTQSLKELELNHNKIGHIKSITHLKKLEKLNVSNNKINALPSNIDELKTLQVLESSGNQISHLPKNIGNLTALQELLVKDNEINYLCDEISHLQNLKHLDLRNNHLSRLPKAIKDLTLSQEGLQLNGNRFNIPQEIFQQEPEQQLQYILDMQKSQNNKPLHEAKLIFIGSGNVGKTSLINMLTRGSFNPKEHKTDGIEIKEWKIKRGNDNIKLHVWDFGGQEIMHATHKFFMTSRTAYVLVVNPRAEDQYGDTELEYWLKLITSYAGTNVPVVVVMNKSDVHKIDLPKAELLDKYPNIIGFVETSCKKQEGLTELRQQIRKAISKLNHIDDLLPKSYFEIKNLLTGSNDDYIPYEKYRELCFQIDKNFEENSMKSLMQLLHDLGIMLNFDKDDDVEEQQLYSAQVLNPEWVTRGVYQIILSKRLFEKKGILNIRDMTSILDNDRYPTTKERHYIIGIMNNFELCYEIPKYNGKSQAYFIPGAFPKDRPKNLNWDYPKTDLLRFQYEYDLLPGSIMPHFIVKIHKNIRARDYWRNGVIISRDRCHALIRAFPHDRKIDIEITGSGPKRDMLVFIRTQFEAIHDFLSNITVQHNIPLDEEGKVCVNYDDLLFYEEKGMKELPIRELDTLINIKEVLTGIAEVEGHSEKTPDFEETETSSTNATNKVGKVVLVVFILAAMSEIGSFLYNVILNILSK